MFKLKEKEAVAISFHSCGEGDCEVIDTAAVNETTVL
jgi:hypothetical protein